MSASLNGRCDHCGGNIEFDAPDTGAIAACPLCGVDTVLQPAADVGADAADAGEADTSSPRKSKRALVIAGIAVALLALAGTAAAVFLKRGNGSGSSSDSSAGRSSTKGAPANTAEDPPKDVTPVVASLQGGMSAAKIRAGREVFLSSCTECHRLYDPAFYSATAWANTLGSMRGKAKLNGRQYEDLQTFVRTLRDP